jgi:hypothetical protein
VSLVDVEDSKSWTARTAEVPLRQLVAVPVDVGKTTAMLTACDFTLGGAVSFLAVAGMLSSVKGSGI